MNLAKTGIVDEDYIKSGRIRGFFADAHFSASKDTKK
jgi:hypothetical protein